MNRTIVISDIHGCFYTFKKLLKKVNFNAKDDKLIVLGDMCDRGKHSNLVWEFCYNLQQNYKQHIIILGNHEDMFLLATKSAKFNKKIANNKINHYFKNGGLSTLKSFYKEANSDNAKLYFKKFTDDYKYLWQWLKNLPLRHQDKNYYYVHAGVNFEKIFYNQTRRDLLWIREPFLSSKVGYKKIIIHGHTAIKEYPFYEKNNIRFNIDGGCVYGGKLNAIIIKKDNIKIEQLKKLPND